jgi:hypothetical protein
MSAQHGDGSRGQGDIAPSAFCLWRLHPQARLRLFNGTLYAERGTLEIDIGLLQSEKLAAAHPGCQRQSDDRVKRVALQRLEDGRDLIESKDFSTSSSSTLGGFRIPATLRVSVPFSTARFSTLLKTR